MNILRRFSQGAVHHLERCLLGYDKHHAQDFDHTCNNSYCKWISALPELNAELSVLAHVNDWIVGTCQIIGSDFCVCGAGRVSIS